VPPPAINMPTFAVYALGVVSTTAALCYVATMAIYYARIFDAGLALEEEVRKRRETTDELRRQVAAADRAGSAKSEFLARMSHELRSPLNAIIGYSQIVREDAQDSGDTALLEDIHRISSAGQYLLRLVDMILDLSKLEAGRMRFNVRPHSLGRLVEQAMSKKRELIEVGGNAVALDFAPGMPSVSVDGDRFCQMLEAIIENAAEHTAKGTITVRSALSETDRTFAVTVSDTGTGIDKDTLATLFETFTTRREAAASRFGGTGLNMSVVYRLCRAMGGTLTVESEVGKGSSFTITMPVAATEESERAASTPVVLPVAA
jgi:signal transduction histidine kinase